MCSHQPLLVVLATISVLRPGALGASIAFRRRRSAVAWLLYAFFQPEIETAMTPSRHRASGFVGRALVRVLRTRVHRTRPCASPPTCLRARCRSLRVSDLTRRSNGRAAQSHGDRVHLAGNCACRPGIAEDAYDRVNRLATPSLRAAKAAGIPIWCRLLDPGAERTVRTALFTKTTRRDRPTPMAAPSSPRGCGPSRGVPHTTCGRC